MTASDYRVHFPYGATSAPYSPTRPHRGDDYPTPTGTPIVINGTTIGLTGATGYVTGPHLHIQEWQGTPANTRKPQNSFKGGTVTAVAASSDFGNYITITKDGWNTTYAHLSKTNVRVGQVIGEDMITEQDISGFVRVINSEVGKWDYNKVHTGVYDAQERAAWLGKPRDTFVMQKWREASAIRDLQRQQLAAFSELSQRPTKAELQAALDNFNAAQKKIAELEATKSQDTILLDEAGNWFTKLFNRLFKKG